MRLLHLVATLLATLVLVRSESDCPSTCVCDKLGTSGIIAKCSALDPNQIFNLEIAALELSNIPESSNLSLTNHIFQNVSLKRVSSIKIVNSTLKTVDVNAFYGLHNLYSLNLSGNNLGLLEPDMFADNMHLERLSLSHNPLEYMQADPSPYEEYFLNVPGLQDIDLSYCNLSHLLPTMFTKLTTVVYVNLANNGIENLSNETFAPLIDLDEVDLSHNKLSHLTPDIFQYNTELSDLKLNNNPLSTISDLYIPYLQTLDISQCLFETVNSNSFDKLTELRSLNLNGNKITSVHADSFKNLGKLQYVDISNNNLKGELPDDLFVFNPQLETIKLKNNPEMKTLPEKGFQGNFMELYLLDLSNCGLTHLQEQSLKKMKRLAYLYLNDNNIEYLKPGVLNSKIVHLELSRNKIAYLDQVSFAANSALRKLYLNENPLKKLSPNNFVNTARLTKLYIKSCALTQLWDIQNNTAQPLKSLIYLNVANNQIININKQDLTYIDRVQTLVLTGNPITCNDDLKEAVNYLVQNNIASSDATEKKHLEEIISGDTEQAVEIKSQKHNLSWKTFMKNVCGTSQKLVEEHTYIPYFETTDEEGTTESGDGETNTDTWETDYWVTNYDPHAVDILREPLDHSRTNYMWPIIIVSLSAFAIILSLVVLAAFLLRWNRQKNSYRNKIIKRHTLITTPRLKRGSGTVYQQLYEDPNTPTTPVMSAKLANQSDGEQRTYTSVDKNTNDNSSTQPSTNTSYLSSPFHHSNIVPESV